LQRLSLDCAPYMIGKCRNDTIKLLSITGLRQLVQTTFLRTYRFLRDSVGLTFARAPLRMPLLGNSQSSVITLVKRSRSSRGALSCGRVRDPISSISVALINISRAEEASWRTSRRDPTRLFARAFPPLEKSLNEASTPNRFEPNREQEGMTSFNDKRRTE